ncbi:MAG: ATPase [Muribaculaceae bacterium]|nr:ATPase [Muribaculaceae bacterium]
MKNKLIADAGSTKVEWALLKADGEVATSFVSDGLNVLLAHPDVVKKTFLEVSHRLPKDVKVEEVHYYGAGCATDEICSKTKEAIAEIWSDADISVASDLLGAARSLFGKRKGIACILGTGSNSCLYDGSVIVSQIPSLGYVLGDEGSGAALGKRLGSDTFKNQLPESIREKFLETYGLTLPSILDNIYRNPSPNKFLASLVPFLHDNLWNPYIYSLVLKELTKFVARNVAMYPGAHTLDLSFTGAIAFHFAKILREAAESLGYRVTSIAETPMEGLLEFHRH